MKSKKPMSPLNKAASIVIAIHAGKKDAPKHEEAESPAEEAIEEKALAKSKFGKKKKF